MNFRFCEDEHGRDPVLMDVDNEGYPIADPINLDNYTHYKPPKKAKDTQGLAGPANYYK